MTQEAIEKIRREQAAAKGLSRCAQVMAGPVADRLCEFCRQEAEFAQAVLQGGDFSECMKAVEKNCGQAISDVDAYAKAVRFYFPGARVRAAITVDLAGDAGDGAPPAEQRQGGVVLNLSDFL